MNAMKEAIIGDHSFLKTVALFSNPAPFIRTFSGSISRRCLAAAAYCFAEELPSNPHLLLLPQNKSYFWVGLLAAALKQGKVILPPNLAPHSLNTLSLIAKEGSSCSLTDKGFSQKDSALKKIDWEQLWRSPDISKEQAHELQICLENLTIELYTSGSSGKPKCITRTGKEMLILAQKGLEHFSWNATDFIVGTVPPQHMFGLETLIFWPFVSGAQIASSRPFFAEDIEECLALGEAERRWLISTPTHLSHIQKFETEWSSKPDTILSATSMLSASLAHALKQRFNSQIYEVYGSTETASFAYRKPLVEDAWTLYSDRELSVSDGAQQACLRLTDLQETHLLQDALKRTSDTQFLYLGRATDMIKVAGKRASLNELNQRLVSIQGVEDGVFYQPYDNGRLTAFVVTKVSDEVIKASLSQFIDPVFLPRPLIKVNAIPRNELGKLSRKNLEALANRYTQPSHAD